MAKIQIGDKGTIRCEVRGFGSDGKDLKFPRTGLILPRTVIVEAFGHLISLFEPEFIPDTPAPAPATPAEFPPLDP
jgi:hypothetical protein